MLGMMITHSTHHRWHREVPEDPLTLYSSKNQRRLQSALSKLDQYDIVSKIELLNDDFIDWFQTFYEQTIADKPNAWIHNIRESSQMKEYIENYYSLTLTEKNKTIGGAVFSLRNTGLLAISFRAFLHKWQYATLQVTPSLLTDFFLAEFAYKHGKKIFSQGLDRNPYGLNSSIGLANFKLMVGCIAKLPVNPEYTETDISNLQQDTLIMLPPEHGDVIQNALLICAPENQQKYKQLISYPERLQVEIQHL